MATYLISYDLRKPGKDYSSLHAHLKTYATRAKPLESVWLIHSNLTAEAVRNAAQAYMDANDKILVIDVTKRAAAWDNLADDVANWIHGSL